MTAQLVPGSGQNPSHVLQLAATGLIALAFGVRCVMRTRALAVATVLGVVLWGSYLAAVWITPSHPVRVGIAALVLGLEFARIGLKDDAGQARARRGR